MQQVEAYPNKQFIQMVNSMSHKVSQIKVGQATQCHREMENNRLVQSATPSLHPCPCTCPSGSPRRCPTILGCSHGSRILAALVRKVGLPRLVRIFHRCQAQWAIEAVVRGWGAPRICVPCIHVRQSNCQACSKKNRIFEYYNFSKGGQINDIERN